MDQLRNGESDGVGLRRISGFGRIALAATGLLSWLAGAVASFLSSNGAGSAALVIIGGLCGMLGLIGRWPSRISMSGNELSWENVDQTVSSQIQAAEESGETETVLAELRSLRERLAVLQQTGSVPEHPAHVYDQAVVAAIGRLLPGAEIFRQDSRSRSVPDFIVRYRGHEFLVETKWRADPAQPFAGSTLPELIEGLPPGVKLLVITNTNVPPRPSAHEVVERFLGNRGRIVSWLDARDDSALVEALASLLKETGSSAALRYRSTAQSAILAT